MNRAALRERLLQFAPLLAALVVFGAASRIIRPPSHADEPHYLLYAHSLVRDGDVDLRNQYASPEIVRRFYGSNTIDTHAYEYRPDGRWVSIHGVGLPMVIAPIVALGGRIGAVRAWMVLLSALMAYELFRLLRQLFGQPRAPLIAAWAGTVFALPLISTSPLIFPDIPAALLIVAALRRAVLHEATPRQLFIAAAAAAFLPILHVRYSLFAAALGVAILVRVYRGPWTKAHMAAALPLLAGAALFPLLQLHLYGSPLPSAAYFPRADIPFFNQGRPQVSIESAYAWGVGTFLSPSTGWLPFAPLHILSLAAVPALWHRFGRWLLAAAVPVGAYFIVLGTFPVGGNLQGRFLVPVLPLFAIPLAFAALRIRWARGAMWALLPLTLAISAAGVTHWALLSGADTGLTETPIVATLQRAFPRFVDPATLPERFEVPGGSAPRETGRTAEDGGGAWTVAQQGVDAEGPIAFGPWLPLREGAYVASFDLGVKDGAVLTVDVVTAHGGSVHAVRRVTQADLAGGPLRVPFELYPPGRVEARVTWNGTGSARVGAIRVEPAAGRSPPGPRRFPGAPLAAAWSAGLVALGVAAYRSARPLPV